MAKGYWVVGLDVTDPERYRAYSEFVLPFVAANGGKFLVRGGRQAVREGTAMARTVVVEFASLEEAQRVYDLAEYQRGIALRANCSDANFVIVEGFDV